MPLAILLRSTAATNRFRDIVLAAARSGTGYEATICSGFFQELFNTSTYRASQESGFAGVLAASTGNVLTIGVHNRVWLPAYVNFRDALVAAGVSVRATTTPGFHWHAKVFLLKSAGVPCFAVIGSSNLTRNAFSDTLPFNFEADVVLWTEAVPSLASAVREILATAANSPYEVILPDYDPERNHGLTIEDRLRRLDGDLLSLPLKDL